MTIGLTGGYCVGKSSAAAILKRDGWTVVDVDALGHRALERSAQAVAALLGPGALRADGSPDRRAIGALVFSDPDLLARYEAVVHPAMNALVEQAVAESGDRVCVDAALLYRLPIIDACAAVIELRAPLLTRLRRGKARDGLSAVAVLKRIARQKPLWLAGKRFAARTVVVNNAGDRNGLERAIRDAISRISTAASYRTPYLPI